MFEFLSTPGFDGGLMQWIIFITAGQQAFVAESDLEITPPLTGDKTRVSCLICLTNLHLYKIK